jgi:hypothetical protein
MEVICMQLVPHAFSRELVDRLMILSMSRPEVLLIPLYIVSHIGGSALDVLLERLQPIDSKEMHRAWKMWSLIIATKFEKATQHILRFVVYSVDGDWAEVFNMIETIALGLDKDPVPIQRQFLIHVAGYLLETHTPISLVQNFLSILRYFVLARPKGYISPALCLMYRESPFFCGEFRKPEHVAEVEGDLSAFFMRLEILATRRKDVIFGLDVRVEGTWADSWLVTLSLPLIHRHSCDPWISQFLPFSKALSAKKWDDLVLTFEDMRYSGIIDSMIVQPSRIAMMVAKGKKKRDEYLSGDAETRVNQFVDSAYTDLQEHIRLQSKLMSDSSKHWSHMWRQLTFDQGPWARALPTEEIHYKRNMLFLRDFCPALLKRHAKFTNHFDAAISRDHGSLATARLKIDEYEKEVAARMKEKAPPKLLDLSAEQTAMSEPTVRSENSEMPLFSWLDARFLTITKSTDCQFVLYRSKAQIVMNSQKVKVIEAKMVTYVLQRCYLHRPNAFEIITKPGRSYFVHLNSKQNLEVIEVIANLQAWKHAIIQTVPHPQFIADLKLTEMWVNGDLSNFQYLMRLNIFGGRTFSDGSLYPVFPWVLCDYESSSIDLTDPSIYRDLKSPMGALTEPRISDLRAHLKDFRHLGTKAFLYNSCYVSPLCIYLWLIRVEPFTTLHIELQSGKFDHAARLFNSIGNAYKMASSHMNDYRELIPEFYFTSTFLENSNKFDLGSINEVPVSGVVLPKWCLTSTDFIYIQRKALESDYISSMLNHWIDLIWGYKQKGKESEQADNTFDPTLYDDVWQPDVLADPVRRQMIESMLRHCGHIPLQLFSSPHATRAVQPNRFSLKTFFAFHLSCKSIWFAMITQKDESPVIRIHCITGKGEFLTITQAVRDSWAESETQVLAHQVTPSRLARLTRVGTFCYSRGKLMLVAVNDIGQLVEIDLETWEVQKVAGHIGQVNCLSVSKDILVTGGADTITNIWSQHELLTTPLYSLTSYHDEILCCAVSQEFGLAVSLTRDGSMFLISTRAGTNLKVLAIAPEIPVLVTITQGWGFVLVYSTKIVDGISTFYISVYTVNGDFVRKKLIPFSIENWMTWVSKTGFDYVVAVAANAELYIFEAYFVELLPFGKVALPVVAMEFFVPVELLVVVTDWQIYVYSAAQMKLERLNKTVFGTSLELALQ